MTWDIDGLVSSIGKAFLDQEVAVLEHIEPFRQALQDRNPDDLLSKVKEMYDKTLESAYGDKLSLVNALCGGPIATVPAAVYNSVGLIYPFLDRQQRDKGLRGILDILDGINSAYIQISHTPYIHEPLLLTDITACRPVYWPGMDEGKTKLKGYLTFEDFQRDYMKEGLLDPKKVSSSFIVGYSLLRADFCPFGEEFVKASNPNFLNRVLKGIVSLRFHPGRGGIPRSEEEIRKGHKRLRELLPESVHDKLEPLRLEADWVDTSQPRFR